MHRIVITAKSSERYPGKNDVLARYTADWVKFALHRRKDLEVVISGTYCPRELSEFKFIPTGEVTHKEAVAKAAEGVDGVCIQAQLTQPMREWWLVDEVIDKAIEHEGKVIITAYPDLESDWRILDSNLKNTPRIDSGIKLIYDGCLYGVYGVSTDAIFDPSHPREVVVHAKVSGVWDIDYMEQAAHPAMFEAINQILMDPLLTPMPEHSIINK